MKVIDVLHKIANGEAPKEIKYDGYTYIYNEKNENYERSKQSGTYLCWDYIVFNELNAEVEIIEEEKKIPEKKDVWYEPIKDTKLGRHDTDTSIEILACMCDDLKDKYNEIIDYLKSKGE